MLRVTGPGERWPMAAISSPTPMACSALTACGLTLTEAPISPNAEAASKTSALIPNVLRALAAASPARPPPTIAMLQPIDIVCSDHSSFLQHFTYVRDRCAIIVLDPES